MIVNRGGVGSNGKSSSALSATAGTMVGVAAGRVRAYVMDAIGEERLEPAAREKRRRS